VLKAPYPTQVPDCSILDFRHRLDRRVEVSTQIELKAASRSAADYRKNNKMTVR
jgi:hypothetical protein